MFRGSIPADMQKILFEHVFGWDCQDIYVGCSGNFTVERAITGKDGTRFNVYGNDITVYSSAIGAYFSGNPLELFLNPDYDDEVGWIREHMGSPESDLATVLLSSRLAPAIGKDNIYYNRVVEGFKAQWPDLIAKTVAMIERSPLKLGGYFAGDVAQWIDGLPKDQGFVSYPPFFGAAKDYEKGFEKLADMFMWQMPEYDLLTGESMDKFFADIQSFKYWLFGTKNEMESMRPYLRGVTRTTNRGVPIFVYASSKTTRVVMPAQPTEHVLVPRLQKGDTIGDRLWLANLTGGQFASLRSLYMNENITPGQISFGMGVMVDDKLVGSFAISASPTLANWDGYVNMPSTYLLSDFPVAPTDYRRLSKLVLYAVLSKECKLLCERFTRSRVRSIVTTAFSARPVSMKYRGLFKLLKRGVAEADPFDSFIESGTAAQYYSQYKLGYGSDMGRWTLAEGLVIWKKKHGKKG